MTKTAFGILALSASWAAVAQEQPPILHEYFEYAAPSRSADDDDLPVLPRPGRVAAAGGDAIGDGPGEDDRIVFSASGPILPNATFGPNSGGLRNGPGGPEGDVRFDLETEAEGMLHYRSVFDPTVAPWKRGSARDTVIEVSGEVALRVGNPNLRPVSVAGAPPDGFDVFDARIDVLAAAGETIPIPSVAPDMRVHELRVTPHTSAEVVRDGADNYYVRLGDDGPHTVAFRASAPTFYFGGPIPDRGASVGAARLPEAAAAAALPVLEAIGLHAGMSELDAVTRLTAWFRDFEARPFPGDARTGNAFRDIALSQVGVCRHRAMAFVVTAAAVGVRARYVHNEAHAFVEVHFSELGWRRIDLGGAAAGLDVSGEAAAAHQPDIDPFGPSGGADGTGDPAFPGTSGDTTGSDGHGGVEEHGGVGEHGDPGTDPGAPSGAQASASTGNDTRTGTEHESGAEHATEHPSAQSDASAGRPTNEASGAPSSEMHFDPTEIAPSGTAPPGAADRRATRLTLALPSRGYRGRTVAASGDLRGEDGTVLAGRELVFELVDARGDRTWLGTALTDANGRYQVELRLPPTTAPGRWEIRAAYAGDDTTRPAVTP